MSPKEWWEHRKIVGGKTLPDDKEWLDRMAVRGLYRIILVSVLSIAVLSMAGLILRTVINDEDNLGIGNADEALSILGNIASASVGGLVGWLTRSLVDTRSHPIPIEIENENGPEEE